MGKKIMDTKQAFDLKYPLAIWNAFLSLFSLLGTIKTLPYLLSYLLNNSYKDSICRNPNETWRNSTTGFWVMLFVISKIPELIDTVFIVLRKKKLIFLHWYHHITVLIYCWDAYANNVSSGLYFVSMNYFIHAIMYGYYCAKSLNVCPNNFPSYIITMLQTTQMLIGSGICLSIWFYIYSDNNCEYNIYNLVFGSIMYLSYLYLFLDFAFKRFKKTKNQ